MKRHRQTFGSAQFAKRLTLIKAGLFKKGGIIVGKMCGHFLYFNGAGYALVFAKTRAGKGAGIVIPNLLSYPGSIICTDIKGENAAITSRLRKAYGPVYVIDLENPELSAGFNPLDLIRFGSTHQVDDAVEIAGLMHLPDPNADNHWDDKSTAAIAALILYVCEKYQSDPIQKTLTCVRELVSQTDLDFHETLEEMVGSSDIPFVRETALDLLAMNHSNEMKSIKSTMDKATRLWSSGSPASLICQKSDFDLYRFVSETHSLYVCIPEEKLSHYQRFLRVVQGMALIATIRTAKKVPPSHSPVLFMLDETAALGYLKPLEQAIGFIAAYVKMVLIFQDIDQLEKTYPKARSIIANASCKVSFGINDYDTAELLSKEIGQMTVTTHNHGRSHDWNEMISHRANSGTGESGRWLLDPSEILRLDQKYSLIFMRDKVVEPIKAHKIRYYQERYFDGKWDVWRGNVVNLHDAETKPANAIRYKRPSC